jgi:hypothetical protein
LTTAQFRELLRTSGILVVDGDDEDNNVRNSGHIDFRLDLPGLANAVWNFDPNNGGTPGDEGGPGDGDGGKIGLLDGSFAYTIQLEPGQHRDDVDFGTRPGDIGGTRIDMTIVQEHTATGENGEVASLPPSAGWVHEWQSFWVEIWVSTPDSTTLAITEAMVDPHYLTGYLTAEEIQYGPAFTEHLTGEIEDTAGRARQIGGRTLEDDLGKEGFVLLARVRLASTGDDQVPVDAVRRSIGPDDMQMALSNGLSRLVGGSASLPVLGSSPKTELWAVMYDIDDNNQIDFGDLSYFTAAFGRSGGIQRFAARRCAAVAVGLGGGGSSCSLAGRTVTGLTLGDRNGA